MKARLRCAQPGRPPFPGLPADRTCRTDVRLEAIDAQETCSALNRCSANLALEEARSALSGGRYRRDNAPAARS
jgi:hypothetical protein